MCHESTSVGLKEAIGVGVGTITLDDFEKTDLMFFFGQNVGTNSPRMLHQLQDARKRGVPIITFNPLREPGLYQFANPQSPVQMLTPAETQISTQYHQVKTGGDTAAILGICKAVIEADDRAMRSGEPRVLDVAFIDEHTTGFEAFADFVRAARMGRDRARERAAARRRSSARPTNTCKATPSWRTTAWVSRSIGMGVQNVRMLCNLLLLRGNIGKPGAGPSPVRGHSNVQGQRTVGITEKPELAPLDKLANQFSFEPPRKKGMNTVEAFEAMVEGKVSAVINLGGNLVRSVPDRLRIEPAWRRLRLTVNVATKLNRSHLVHGEKSYILPCLSRIEIDTQASGEQAVSMEDSTGCMHGSRGVAEPASPRCALRAVHRRGAREADARRALDRRLGSLARRLRARARRDREDVSRDLSRLQRTHVDARRFPRHLPARERKWKTKSGKAEFVVPESLGEDPDMPEREPRSLRLMTLRSDSQFNTTIYSLDDRFRGVKGTAW